MRQFIVIAAMLLLPGCGGGSSGTSPASTGTLIVVIDNPFEITPAVTITGPNGYHHALSASNTLTGLPPGSYTVSATGNSTGRTSQPVVSSVDTIIITGSPATIAAGTTDTASVQYGRPGSGAMWVIGNSQPVVADAYSGTQLQAGGAFTPELEFDFADYQTLATGAFDAAGNLWLVNSDSGRVEEYTPSQFALTPNQSRTATVTVGGITTGGSGGVAFDGQGNLWIASPAGNTVVEYTAAQIATSGSPTPAVTLGGFSDPLGVAFDPHGNLWVANSGSNTLVELSTSQLATSGSPIPVVTLGASGGSLNSPAGLAFDSSGDLWVANAGGTTVVEYTPPQLAANQSPAPHVTLGGLAGPTALALDNSGDLWVAEFDSTSVDEFPAGEITANGTPLARQTITETAPSAILFDPPPSGLPLAGANRVQLPSVTASGSTLPRATRSTRAIGRQ